tara:strand:+ start:907 stop:1929 length:1023 start_codon:yes stop_codon:yes gene_type:complete
VNNIKIQIKNLYKIFGSKSLQMMQHVQDGMSKEELLEKYNHVLGLDNININIPEKGIQVIMGLSGAGKSTLIRHINRLIEPTSGEIIIDSENVLSMKPNELRDFRRFKSSMVFQKFALLPHKTIFDNVGYGLKIQSVQESTRKKICEEWIEKVGLSGFENHYPAQLSGGMQQRVGLIRALSTDPEILLMDEAFSALDPLIRFDMQSILLQLQKDLNKTIVFITHDLSEALRIGDNIVILRGGAMIQQGSAQEIVLNPIDDYVSDFTKDINRGKVLKVGFIMEKVIESDGPMISQNTSLEDALQILTNTEKNIGNVTNDSDSKIVGSITIKSIAKAITRTK